MSAAAAAAGVRVRRVFLVPLLLTAAALGVASALPVPGGAGPVDMQSEPRLLLASFAALLALAGLAAARLVDFRERVTAEALLPVQLGVVAGAFLPIGFAAFWRMLDANSGDAGVYLGFARYAWEAGPFHYGMDGPVHGATSPLWAVALMAIEPFARTAPWLYELPGLLSALAAVAASAWLARTMCRDAAVAVLAAALVAVSLQAGLFAGRGFETSFVMAALSCATRATVRVLRESSARRAAAWSCWVGALALSRPEGVLFAVVLSLVWMAHAARRDARVLGWVAVAALPALAFHLWLYARTGILIPTSVTARVLTLREASSPWDWIQAAIGLPWTLGSRLYALFALALFAAGVRAVARRARIEAAALVAPIAVMLVAFAADPPDVWSARRYGAVVTGQSAVAVAIGLAAGLRGLARRLPGGVPAGVIARFAVTVAALGLLLGPASLTSHRWASSESGPPLDRVLDRAGGEWLDANLPADARLLTYEIQAQARTARQLVSADGIVGGEILPYLARRQIAPFIEDAHITHVAVSYGYDFRPEFEGTLLHALWERDPQVPVGGIVELDGLRLEKQVARPEQPAMRAHWTAIYAVRRSGAPRAEGRAAGRHGTAP